ncbi:MFS transporter [Clostridium swellfunianum]|uniref:MFS transporter n=1 Tax=Clostridium swellfunianum TaxID=1367462 RepID=UPI00202F7A60|nr:MFS transporter [Clostridium swellfunianum]MCM0649931.1 MFS transporter [Clostridium swellfunianum]
MCREAKILLIVSALFTFAMGLSGIFINVFFWKETNSFIIIVLYNLMHYITTPIAFISSGALAKKKNGIWSLRLGLLIYAIFFGMILFAGARGIWYIYLLGAVYGLATGCYWLAFNTLAFDFTGTNNRDTFNGFNGSCAGIAAAAAPITSAYIISSFSGSKGYNIVFTITLALFILLIFISLLLKCKNYGSKLNWNMAVGRNCEEWSIIRKTTIFWGIRDVTIVFIINILIIETTKSEMSLGKLTLIAALLSSAAYVLVQKIIKPPKRRLAILIGTLGSFAAILGIVYKVSYVTLLGYTMIDAFFLPFFLIQFSSSTFNVINRAHDEDLRIEYMINKDIVINAGRIISAAILVILLLIFNDTSILKVYLLFIGLAPVAAGFFLRKLKAVLEGDCSKN